MRLHLAALTLLGVSSLLGQTVFAQFTSVDIGNPAISGSATPVAGGYTITGGGTNIAGNSDQFFFAYESRTGDFDVKLRVASLSAADAWSKAGLMAREALTTNSRYAAVFATPNINGCYFSQRATTNGTAANSGSFPAGYPSTWLRLKRAGTTFTGYAGIDGEAWSQLGSITLSSPGGTLSVGMAVTSADANEAVTAQVRDVTDVVGGTVGNVELPFEPPGPSSRNTGLVISEIMYHPRHTNDLEFIELLNAGLIAENLTGYRIAGDVDYTFPNGTILDVGERLVIARYPANLENAYGISGVLGPWTGNGASAPTNALPDDEGTVRLRNRSGAVLLEVTYTGKAPWPIAPDGAGHSLVLSRPSYGEADYRAWSASDQIGGSPGAAEPVVAEPLRPVVINEFLAHTDDPLLDYIELYNHGNQSVEIAGAYLTDDRDTNKFQIPPGTPPLPPRGFVVFDQSQLGFSLSSGGERIYLVNSNQTRVVDVVAFEAQANGVSSGRYPDGGPGFHELTTRTPGAVNTALLIRDIVINELMYNPISERDSDEYVELYNRGAGAVNVGNWRFTDGIDFLIPANTMIPANGYLVIAKNHTNLLANYPQLNAGNTLGDYGGTLANGGERVALAMPDYFLVTNNNVVVTQANYIVVDEVTYTDGGHWSTWADGGGSSLELIDPNSDHRLPANWADSDETMKSAWTNLTTTGVLDNNYPVDSNGALLNEIQIMILGQGEALMDDLLARSGTAGANLVVNPDFATGATGWVIQGNHVRSTLEPVGPNNPSQCLHIRATAGGDNGANRVEANLSSALTVNTVATIGGRFRWLRGFPIVLVRLHGGAIEAVASLPVPKNLGTPGQVNSRRLPNAGPAIYDVSHAPILPAPGEPVIVRARVSDPDGIASVQLRYRLDPSATVNSLPMRDDGTGGDAVAGDGVYTATVPGQAIGTNAFRVAATDAAGSPANALFPEASHGECLWRWGEPPIFGSLGVYHLWMTASNINFWTVRERLSNEAVDGTMVYGNFRVIYNAGARYRGSPFTRNPSSPNGVGVAANYVWTLPDDDHLLGTDELNLDCLEPAGSTNVRDVTALREVTSFTMLDHLDLPFSFQRYVHVVINGVTSASRNIPIYTDSQQPNGEYIAMWFPDDTDGDLFKIDDWFEFDDTPARQGNKSASLENFTTPSGSYNVKKQARYRWSWEKKFNRGLDDDYSKLFAAVDALNTTGEFYFQRVDEEFEIREWLTALAFRHVVGDWDGYGYQRGKNQFCYRPRGGKFWMLMWDLDFAIGCNSGHGPNQDLFTLSLGGATSSDNMPEVARLYSTNNTRRMYLQALQQLAEGPMQDASFLPTLDARYRALLANGVTAITSPFVASGAQNLSLPAWIQQRRGFITTNASNPNRISLYTNAPFRVTSPLTVTTNGNRLNISGTGSLLIKDILVNGVAWPVTWTSITSWTARVVLNEGSNSFLVEGTGLSGNIITSNQTVIAEYTGASVPPQGAVVFNEIMYKPGLPEASFVELFNRSASSFDISGWRINGLDYSFPPGSIVNGGQYLVLMKNPAAYSGAFGSNAVAFGRFDGNLDPDGETLTLIKPGGTNTSDIVIDKVRYEAVPPWAPAAASNGSSLQLIDEEQDNARVSNWDAGFGWKFASRSGNIVNGTNLLLFLTQAGNCYIDDVSLVGPEGTNVLVNGGFESGLDPWIFGSNYASSVVVEGISHSGNRSLFLNGAGPGGTFPQNLVQYLLDSVTQSNTYTLSFYALYNTNPVTVNMRALPGNNLTTNLVTAAIQATPGSLNLFAAALPPYDPLWLNEVQTVNTAGVTDNNGEREPWLELYNAGNTPLDLNGYYLANNYDTNLLQWPFPAGSSIQPGEFKIVWGDGQPAQTSGTNLHTGFRFGAGPGSLALVRIVNSQPQITDYLNYPALAANLSYGDYPDGQPFNRVVMFDVTPGATNIARNVNVFINEWMAANTNTLSDPADGQFEDWFELYNAGTDPVDLGGYFLTDDLGDRNKYLIPNNGQYVIPPGGFLLVWADGEPGQNNSNRIDLHADFNLRAAGEAIGLFDPNGTQIDAVTFGTQTDDISEGRFTDGAMTIYPMTMPTPRAPNVLVGGNNPPFLAAIADRTIRLTQTVSFTAMGTDADAPPQMLTYSLGAGAPMGASINSSSGAFTWTPAPAQAPSTNSITVRVTDNGVPALSASRTFTVTVLLPPEASISRSGDNVSLTFDTIPGRMYRVEYKDDLSALNWTPLGAPVVAAGPSLSVNDTITSSPQRFYRIVQLD